MCMIYIYIYIYVCKGIYIDIYRYLFMWWLEIVKRYVRSIKKFCHKWNVYRCTGVRITLWWRSNGITVEMYLQRYCLKHGAGCGVMNILWKCAWYIDIYIYIYIVCICELMCGWIYHCCIWLLYRKCGGDKVVIIYAISRTEMLQ